MVIIRISEANDRVTRTRLPGDYGDAQQAIAALDKVLASYKAYGQNDEHGYAWARDDEGQTFRFVIED